MPVGQSWEEERLNPSASHKPTVLSDPVLWTAQLSFLFQKDGAERNDAKLSCGTKELFGYPLQSSQTVRDHSLTQRLLYLPQCAFGTFFDEEWRQITLWNGSCWLLRILKWFDGADRGQSLCTYWKGKVLQVEEVKR